MIGYALDPPSVPNHFEAAKLSSHLQQDIRGDVRNVSSLEAVFEEHRPDIVFHLAAQSLIRRGYDEPRLTFDTNLMGTVNVLDCAQRCPSVQTVVSITSDKCYANQEWPWGYRETDQLGGYDPYSASKACAELAIAVFQNSTYQKRSVGRQLFLPISSARAGNVVGGGDWATDRLIPDVIRALISGTDVVIRRPDATRPWQHVLEPVSGYLWLAASMVEQPSLASAFNFGPESTGRGVPVEQVVKAILKLWNGTQSRLVVERDHSATESTLLRLDCSRADVQLGWRPVWHLDETLEQTVSWYRRFYCDSQHDMFAFAVEQIERYAASAAAKSLRWSIE